MRHRSMGLVAAVVFAGVVAHADELRTEPGPYARIAVLRPLGGRTVDFEAGYVRHLDWHRRAGDPWTWYGWTVWAGERQRWFVYATFGRSAASLDDPVAPADDERDNVLNVVPHAEFVSNAVYEFLPDLSRGTGVPPPTPRLELTTVDLVPGAGTRFETLVRAGARPPEETLWFRMAAGGTRPRYVRLRPRPSLSAILVGAGDREWGPELAPLVAKTTVEILTLRPAMSLGLVTGP